MNEDRANLAQLLVDIAANLANAAAKAEETTKKQALLAKLDEHRQLMDNPSYMTATMRNNLANQIHTVTKLGTECSANSTETSAWMKPRRR